MNKASRLLMSAFVLALSLMPGPSGARNPSVATPQQTSPERSQNVKININIGGKILIATLADNATARDFVSVLPLSLSMKDLFGREKYGDLPKELSENGPRKNRYEVGDIAYWSPNQQVAVYYHQDGESISSPGIIPIAKMDGETEAFNVSGTVKVTIELAR
jgi:hypothetical protein